MIMVSYCLTMKMMDITKDIMTNVILLGYCGSVINHRDLLVEI